MSEAFDPVEAARAIGELTAHVKMMPSALRPIGEAVIGLCDVLLEVRTRDAARIADLERQLAEARRHKDPYGQD